MAGVGVLAATGSGVDRILIATLALGVNGAGLPALCNRRVSTLQQEVAQ